MAIRDVARVKCGWCMVAVGSGAAVFLVMQIFYFTTVYCYIYIK